MNKILAGYLLLFSLIGFCQNRTNDNLPLISKDNKGILLQAKGWLKNQYGEWISRNNKIPNDLSIENKSIDNFQHYSLGKDNFISYQIKDIVIKDSTYVLLIKKEKWGYYIYPHINEEWRISNTCKYYIFNKSELNKFKNLYYDELKIITINLNYFGWIQPVDLTKLTDLYLAKEINKTIIEQDKKKYYVDNEKELYINLNCLEKNDKVQFYFYTRFEDPKDRYYETDLATFNKFIKIN